LTLQNYERKIKGRILMIKFWNLADDRC
jgi:hypothetical protein